LKNKWDKIKKNIEEYGGSWFLKQELVGVLNLEQFQPLTSGENLKSRFVFCLSIFIITRNFYCLFLQLLWFINIFIFPRCRKYEELESLGILVLSPVLYCIVNMILYLQTLWLPVNILGLHHKVWILMMMV